MLPLWTAKWESHFKGEDRVFQNSEAPITSVSSNVSNFARKKRRCREVDAEIALYAVSEISLTFRHHHIVTCLLASSLGNH
jgi:hypothetical protein